MFCRAFSIGGALLLAGALVLATPGLSRAQHGGHGGGGHAGGGHGGGYYGGTHTGGYGGMHTGGYGGTHAGGYGGIHTGGYHYDSPHEHHEYHENGAYRYPFNWGYGYSYPYYGGNGYAYPYYDGYSGLSNGSLAPYSGNVTPDLAPSAGVGQSSYAPPIVISPSDTRAHVTVKVPADAQVRIENSLMKSTGAVREFVSPPLSRGSDYVYSIVAQWNENGHEVTRTQEVVVTAGSHPEVDFLPGAQNTAVTKSP